VNVAKKKLGPLPLWQWILIGAALGIGTVLYRRGHPAAQAAGDAVAAATPSDAEYNPIDPTTGLPISGGFSTGPATSQTGDVTSPADQFAGYLSNLETLLSLVSPADASAGAASETDQGAVQTQVGTKKAKPKKTPKKKAKPKKTTRAGDRNPGHHVTAHGNGKKTAGSSAPHNPRQHHNVQSPSHQRHAPTRHPSARNVATKTGGHGHVPTATAHPPAKTRARRRRRR